MIVGQNSSEMFLLILPAPQLPTQLLSLLQLNELKY